jgi:hypothetical protein
MRRRNHDSLPKGIPKIKLQASAVENPEILQSQSRQHRKKRLSSNRQSDLREDGLITFRANEVRVHDWERLRSVAGFDPAYLQLRPEPSIFPSNYVEALASDVS